MVHSLQQVLRGSSCSSCFNIDCHLHDPFILCKLFGKPSPRAPSTTHSKYCFAIERTTHNDEKRAHCYCWKCLSICRPGKLPFKALGTAEEATRCPAGDSRKSLQQQRILSREPCAPWTHECQALILARRRSKCLRCRVLWHQPDGGESNGESKRHKASSAQDIPCLMLCSAPAAERLPWDSTIANSLLSD